MYVINSINLLVNYLIINAELNRKLLFSVCEYTATSYTMEYGSTPYVGMARKKDGRHM